MYIYPGISNLLQPAQAEVVLGQLSMYFASWNQPQRVGVKTWRRLSKIV
jgi:hypothetical protein